MTHVVVTIYTSHGRQVVHAYGPYTQSQANSERRKILKNNAWWTNFEERLTVSACKVLNMEEDTTR